eukprot:scaffold303960_cov67-Attheya_sp.AAC.1
MCPRTQAVRMDMLRPREKRERGLVSKKNKSRIGGNNSRQEGKTYHRSYQYDRKKPTTTWNISTWAKHLRHSSMEKNSSAAGNMVALPE